MVVGSVSEHNGVACMSKRICSQHLIQQAGFATHHNWLLGPSEERVMYHWNRIKVAVCYLIHVLDI